MLSEKLRAVVREIEQAKQKTAEPYGDLTPWVDAVKFKIEEVLPVLESCKL